MLLDLVGCFPSHELCKEFGGSLDCNVHALDLMIFRDMGQVKTKARTL